MINQDEQPDPLEIIPEQPSQPEPVIDQPSEITEELPDQVIDETLVDTEPLADEDTPPPVQTDIEQAEPVEQPQVSASDTEPLADEDTPPPVQTDIEQAEPVEQPQVSAKDPEPLADEDTPLIHTETEQPLVEVPVEEELLLPAKATPDEITPPDSVVIHSPETSKSFRLRTWLIALLFVIIIAIIGMVLYIFVFKANATVTPGTQIFGS
jgi:hypothetical protein